MFILSKPLRGIASFDVGVWGSEAVLDYGGEHAIKLLPPVCFGEKGSYFRPLWLRGGLNFQHFIDPVQVLYMENEVY